MFNNLKGNLGSSGNKTIRRSGNFSEILFRRSFTFIEKKSKQIVQSDVYAVANITTDGSRTSLGYQAFTYIGTS